MKKRLCITFNILVFTVVIAWGCGIIPKMIGMQTAISYVSKNYSEMNLAFSHIDFSPAYDEYIASFTSKDGHIYNFKLSSKYFPTEVTYDSIKQSYISK